MLQYAARASQTDKFDITCASPLSANQIPDNGREELSNETYYPMIVPEIVAVAMDYPFLCQN